MCGIVGKLDLFNATPAMSASLRAMLGTIRHRGPDQFGLYTFHDDNISVGLGSARLSIIDLAAGQQPLSNEDGTLWIVYNGEIFNYLELRPELEREGHYLATDSDTEIILHLYEQYGPACLHLLNGQFSFAIWDERARMLFLARDRLGIRPLYYTVQSGTLLFASEMKAILAAPRIAAELDPLTLDQIFTFWSPLSPRTIFRGIQTLPPGHYMVVRPGGEIETHPYWNLAFASADQPYSDNVDGYTIDALARQLGELLLDATRIRLRADVPVGAYLSGGLDSATIAALTHRYTGNCLETFSIAFADSKFDESSFQQQMAAELGTRHHSIVCTSEEIGRVFPDVIWHTEAPILRTSPAPLYLLSRLVHDHNFKVVLTGEGADEFLAGYNIFKEAKLRRFWAREPESQWRPQLLRKLYPYISGLGQGSKGYLQAFFGQGLSDTGAADYSHIIRWRNTGRIKRFFSAALRADLALENDDPIDQVHLPAEFEQWSPLAQAQYLEITIFLSEYLLSSQGDRVAMAHSVEGRFPFLDYRVVEFCNQLPPHLKLRGLNEKYLLKRAVRDLLPETIWQRPKRPYRAPIHQSFFPANRPLDWVAEVLSPSEIKASGYFEPLAVTNLIKKIERFGTLSETDDMALAGLLSTQLVYRQFIAAFAPPGPLDDRDDIKLIMRGAHTDALASATYTSRP